MGARIVLFWIFLMPFSLWPSTGCRDFYVISDFDDTIKTYTSKGAGQVLYHAFFKKEINAGFDLFIKELEKNGHDNCKDTFLNIVSASPWPLKYKISELLKLYSFPDFKLSLRPLTAQSRVFKKETLSHILEKKPGPFLLFGDDLHDDPEIYHELKEKYPEKILAIYIHNINNRPPIKGQETYFTTFDLAFKEYQQGRVSLRALKKIGQKIMFSSPWKVIPPYGHCPPLGKLKLENEEYLELVPRVEARLSEICESRKL